MNYVFAYVFKKDKDDKGKFDLNKDVHKRAIYGSNLKRAISALERELIEEESIAVSYTHLTLPTICSV